MPQNGVISSTLSKYGASHPRRGGLLSDTQK